VAFREITFEEIDQVSGGYWRSYSYYSSGYNSGRTEIWGREWVDDQPLTTQSSFMVYFGANSSQYTGVPDNDTGYAPPSYDSNAGGGGGGWDDFLSSWISHGSYTWTNPSLLNEINQYVQNLRSSASNSEDAQAAVQQFYAAHGITQNINSSHVSVQNNTMTITPGDVIVTGVREFHQRFDSFLNGLNITGGSGIEIASLGSGPIDVSVAI
jgi:hypothetical protein